jgi:hypothetical protein
MGRWVVGMAAACRYPCGSLPTDRSALILAAVPQIDVQAAIAAP